MTHGGLLDAVSSAPLKAPLLQVSDASTADASHCQSGAAVTLQVGAGGQGDVNPNGTLVPSNAYSAESLAGSSSDSSSGPYRQDSIRTLMKKITRRPQITPLPVISSPFQHRPDAYRADSTSQSVRERLREQVVLSCLIMFAEGFYGTQFFPYGGWMVEELRASSRNVGFYTGLLFTVQSSGMLMTSYLWASVSNRQGRRFCLLIGLAAGILATLLQAFSRDYWVVAGVRFFSGLMNSNLSIMRTALRESFQHERSEDTWAFSTLSVAFSASCMAGPSMGGVLYGKPIPMLGGAQNSWTLPMLTCFCLYALCFTLTWWRLPETAFLSREHRARQQASDRNRIDEHRGSGQPLLRDVNFILLLIMGGGHSYVFTGWEIVYPLFARTPLAARGEAWTAAQIGVTFFMGSCGLCLYSLALYPVIAKRLTIIRLWCLSWVVPLVVFPTFPRLLTWVCASGQCEGRGALVSALNYVPQVLISILIGSGFISLQVLLNNYVGAKPDGKTTLALANSMMVSMQALVRAVSPVVTGSSFAFGLLEEAEPSRLGLTRSLPFDCLAIVGLVTGLLCALAFEARTSGADEAN